MLAVTDVPHNGCKKFKERYGRDALTDVHAAVGKSAHLRGIYVRVGVDGRVAVGDGVTKRETSA